MTNIFTTEKCRPRFRKVPRMAFIKSLYSLLEKSSKSKTTASLRFIHGVFRRLDSVPCRLNSSDFPRACANPD